MEKVKQLLKSLAEGKSITEQLSTLTKDELDTFQEAAELLKAKFISPAKQQKNRAKIISKENAGALKAADIKSPEPKKEEQPKKASHLTVIKDEDGEVVKTSERGQWSLHKNLHVKDPTSVAKPKMTEPKTLDYAAMNKKPDYASIEANAPTIDYKKMNAPSNQPANWKAKMTPEAKSAAYQKMSQIKRAQYAEQAKTGVIRKNEGVLLDEEPKNKERLVAKDDMAGYGPDGQPSSAMAMSEREPHKDDRQHEEKEQVKAKKIKEKAQELLDMHKAEKANSVFTMDHAHAVLGMAHDKAKEHLHAAVDSSGATPANKSKIKAAISGSKSVKDLSHMVSNHVLAAGGKGIGKVGEHKVIR